jgi:hypothetical protein
MAAKAKATPNDADSNAALLQMLLDRVAIEELFVRYYSGLGGGDPAWFGKFFEDGAELDVNGIVVHGEKEITELYKQVKEDKPNLTGQFRMILSNMLIEIEGDEAHARMMWTQTLNETLKGQPRLIEQGLEWDSLVKRGGAWRITRRVVIADSNLPDMMDKTYTPRKNFKLAPLGKGKGKGR